MESPLIPQDLDETEEQEEDEEKWGRRGGRTIQGVVGEDDHIELLQVRLRQSP